MSRSLNDNSNSRFILAVSLIAGLLIGTLAGTGVVFHDGRPAADGLLTGAGFFVFGFLLFYFRLARRIAEFLSSLS